MQDGTTVSDVATPALTTVRPGLTGLELLNLIMRSIRDDTQFQQLTGATATDPRVYYYYHPSAILSERQPAYVTYSLTWPSMVDVAVGQPVLTLAVWGLSLRPTMAVRDRLVTLLVEDGLLTTSGDKRVKADNVGEHDSFQEDTKFTGRTIQFRFGFSKV